MMFTLFRSTHIRIKPDKRDRAHEILIGFDARDHDEKTTIQKSRGKDSRTEITGKDNTNHGRVENEEVKRGQMFEMVQLMDDR